MTEAPGSSSTGSATSTKLRKAAQKLLDVLSDERAHHGGLMTDERIAAEGRLRLVLSRYTE
jgi:hypothetical protein